MPLKSIYYLCPHPLYLSICLSICLSIHPPIIYHLSCIYHHLSSTYIYTYIYIMCLSPIHSFIYHIYHLSSCHLSPIHSFIYLPIFDLSIYALSICHLSSMISSSTRYTHAYPSTKEADMLWTKALEMINHNKSFLNKIVSLQ